MRRGEVRWYRFRPPDKERPVLLLTRDSVLSVLGDVTAATLKSSAPFTRADCGQRHQYRSATVEVECRTPECRFHGPLTFHAKELERSLPDVLPCPACGEPWTVRRVEPLP